MYNFSFNSVLPFTAVTFDYDRLLNGLAGIIIIPLFFLIGFSAIESDFGKIESIDSNNIGLTMQSNYYSDCTVGQRNNCSPRGSFLAGDFPGKGMIFCSYLPDDQSVNSSLNKDCEKLKAVAYDSTVYQSSDLVDRPPELIWMVYPDLSRAESLDVPSVQVTLSVLVDYTGKVLEVTIADESLLAHGAKQIILESVKTSLFRPAQKNNHSVNCWVQIPLEVEV